MLTVDLRDGPEKLRKANTVALFGNGGNMAVAQHMAEQTKRAEDVPAAAQRQGRRLHGPLGGVSAGARGRPLAQARRGDAQDAEREKVSPL